MAPSIIKVDHFIKSTRDSGYKNLSAALAELIDNSLESGAKKIEVKIQKLPCSQHEKFEIEIVDNGAGMTQVELSHALQFGGSTRFNSRTQFGRYGMGLPNSSLSQCRRVEVITWKTKKEVFHTFLDVDDVVRNKLSELTPPQRLENYTDQLKSKSGTIVTLKKCDRIAFKYLGSLFKQLHTELGRTFRNHIWEGVTIILGDQKVLPLDPLFIGEGINLQGGKTFGNELTYNIKIPATENKYSEVKVKFVELPVEKWASLSNDEKRKLGITKNAGVSILRAGREIDYGWYFMGEKRKENYDDWWRCEISFHPALDEVFGVTHTKQEIRETEFMKSILVPDIEQTARTLNQRVRLKFIDFKKDHPIVYAKNQLERTDGYLPSVKSSRNTQDTVRVSAKPGGMQYKIRVSDIESPHFFRVNQTRAALILTINDQHPFYTKIFRSLHERKVISPVEFLKVIEVLLFAAARSELMFKGKANQQFIDEFKGMWSSNLKTLIS
jgi:hypothetical protein